MSALGGLRAPSLPAILPRRRRIQLSFRTRLVLWYNVVLAIVLMFFSTVLYISLSQSLYQELDNALEASGEIVIQTIRISRDLTISGDAIRKLPADAAVSVFSRSGRSYVRLNGSELLQPTPQMTQSVESGRPILSTEIIRGERWRIYTRPVYRSGEVAAVVEIGQPMTEIERTLQARLLVFVFTIPISLVLTTGGAIFLSSRAVAPIARIVQTVRTIQAGDLSQRVAGPSEADELGRLVQTFNAMLDRLEAAFRRERQFTGDAAHELRTPLAVIKNQIDVMLERDRSTEEYRESLISIGEDVDRMTVLLTRLLDLARSEESPHGAARAPVDLGQLAAEIVEGFQLLAEERGITLQASISGPVIVDGDAARLSQILTNLLDNAVSYTPSGGHIEVRAYTEGPTAKVAVIDDGVGIAPEHLPHLFDRFYRVDRARARAEGHYGLGLALGAAIAREHDGRIDVQSAPGKGSHFTFRVPRSRPADSAHQLPP